MTRRGTRRTVGPCGRREGRVARWTFAADAVLATSLFVGSLIVVEGPDQEPAIRSLGEVPVGAFVVLGIASGALFWRRRRPLEVLAATTVGPSSSEVVETQSKGGAAIDSFDEANYLARQLHD